MTGKLADTPLRSAKNIGIVILTLASRAAIRGGLDPETAFTIEDAYVQQIEKPKYKAEHPSKHPPMPNAKRAAQFSAFKALTGMDSIYSETEKEHTAQLSKWENRKY